VPRNDLISVAERPRSQRVAPPDLTGFPPPKDLPTERLIAQLPGVEATVRGKRTQLQWVIDELRRRKISWADIGQALGISRQSAWERFS
jgi:hypothetical protein